LNEVSKQQAAAANIHLRIIKIPRDVMDKRFLVPITAGTLMDSKFDSLRSSCGAGNPARPGCSQSDIDSVSSRQTTANVFWGLAAAAAVTTGVLFYFEGQPVTVAPVAGGTTGAVARVGF